MDVLRSRQFDRWVRTLLDHVRDGDPVALAMAKHVSDQIAYLRELAKPPTLDEETATLKWVRQSRKYLLWRLSHPHDALVAARLIVWFDDETDTAVIALFAGDKAQMGDLFYDSVGTRGDQIVDLWKAEKLGGKQ
ncbi:MAG: hypothetical protein FWD11_07910 [Micrococcales bacterium]|nr:hypothetical protein [Micrococcales bacterium]